MANIYAMRWGHSHTRGIFHSAKRLKGLPYHFYVGFKNPTGMLQLLPGEKKSANIMVSKYTRCVHDVITDNTHIVPENYMQLTLPLHSGRRYISFLNSVCMYDVPNLLKSNSLSSRTQAGSYSFWKRFIRTSVCLTFSSLQLTATAFHSKNFRTSVTYTNFKKILFY